jgi:putative addiction module component (TIGR02574 family)
MTKRRSSMAHTRDEIERDALSLPAEDRAHLAVRLLNSLEDTLESPDEMEKLWFAEANRRFQELREGVVEGIPASDVFSELRTGL